ncbi:MAG: FecR domain-containing protein [Cyclobacteriaceae bacterium]
MTKWDYDSINELITKHLAGEASVDEQRELSAWIQSNPENQRHFKDLKKAFDLTETHFTLPPPEGLKIDVDQEWDHFTEATGIRKTTRPLSPSRVWLKIAASVLLLIAASGILYYYTSQKTTVYQTAENKETITLPDGSTVTLNRYSHLSYDPDFGGKNRTVNLEGEAFFDVERDTNRPFTILTEKTMVQVLGTSFNVNAYDSLQSVEVIVETGIVSLQPKTGQQKLQLVAGQKGIYSKTKGELTRARNDDINFRSWNTQRIVFVENDLRSVIETLKKTYNADIRISTDIPSLCSVTVTFDHQTLESVLKVLESTLNLKYTIVGNRVEITEAGC